MRLACFREFLVSCRWADNGRQSLYALPVKLAGQRTYRVGISDIRAYVESVVYFMCDADVSGIRCYVAEVTRLLFSS